MAQNTTLYNAVYMYFKSISAFVDVRLKKIISARKNFLKLFHNYFWGLLQLTNSVQHVQCRWNNFEIIYYSSRRGYMWINT